MTRQTTLRTMMESLRRGEQTLQIISNSKMTRIRCRQERRSSTLSWTKNRRRLLGLVRQFQVQKRVERLANRRDRPVLKRGLARLQIRAKQTMWSRLIRPMGGLVTENKTARHRLRQMPTHRTNIISTSIMSNKSSRIRVRTQLMGPVCLKNPNKAVWERSPPWQVRMFPSLLSLKMLLHEILSIDANQKLKVESMRVRTLVIKSRVIGADWQESGSEMGSLAATMDFRWVRDFIHAQQETRRTNCGEGVITDLTLWPKRMKLC